MKRLLFLLTGLFYLLYLNNGYSQEQILILSKVNAYFAEQSFKSLQISIKDNKPSPVFEEVKYDDLTRGKIHFIQRISGNETGLASGNYTVSVTGLYGEGKDAENIDLSFNVVIDENNLKYVVDENVFTALPPLSFDFSMAFKKVPKILDFVGMSFSSTPVDIDIPLNYVPSGMTFYWDKQKHGIVGENSGKFACNEITENRDFKFYIVVRIGNFNENYLVMEFHYTKAKEIENTKIEDRRMVVGKFIVYRGRGFILRDGQMLEVKGEAEVTYGDQLILNPLFEMQEKYEGGRAVLYRDREWRDGQMQTLKNGWRMELIGNGLIPIGNLEDDRTVIEKLKGKLWYYCYGIPEKEHLSYIPYDNLENKCGAALGSRSVYYVDSREGVMEIKVFEGEVNGTFLNTDEKFILKEGEYAVLNNNDKTVTKNFFNLIDEISQIESPEIKDVIKDNFKLRGITDLSKIGNENQNQEVKNEARKDNSLLYAEYYGIQLPLYDNWEKITDPGVLEGGIILNDGQNPDGSAFISVLPKNQIDAGVFELLKGINTTKSNIDGQSISFYETDINDSDMGNIHILLGIFDNLKINGTQLSISIFVPGGLWSYVSENVNKVINNIKIKK